ncbi:MAG TPA: hypothetical protein VG125_31055 [Pirellulales bacterium]|nr:hypothetical protein [Pirellulales bacterium]
MRWLVGLWTAYVVGGMLALGYHASVPGNAAQPPRRIAADVPGGPPAGKATLLLFLHPQCPCSRATIGELARAVSRRSGGLDTRLFFYRPGDSPPGWEKTDLWQMAEGIPGTRLFADADGALAARFGVRTSGQALLYDPEGGLVFAGGMTGARGHAGDNSGQSAILSWFSSGHVSVESTPVFGCSLASGSPGP